jgi:amino acid transporter
MLSPPAPAPAHAVPDRRLSEWHAVSICIGMVIGAGIFITTPLAAANLPTAGWVIAAWIFGGAMSLAGALCFAEMATAFPDAGGDYNFLRRAYGDGAGFLFAWSRFAVIHTGSMALLGFTFGDYLATLVPLGEHGATWFAAATIVTLAAVNLAGLKFGIGTQVWLLWLVLAGMVAVIAAGAWLAATGAPSAAPLAAGEGPASDAGGWLRLAPGAALVYVFLAYGGWSDTATLSAEMRDSQRGMRRALLFGMGLVTVLYVLANWAYLRGLSHLGLARSEAPAADLMLHAFGARGQALIVAIVAVTSITSMNAIMIAGARTTYAAGRDTPSLARWLGRWHVARGTPGAAIVATAGVALALVAFGDLTRGGFSTMVDYLSPVYWLFLTLSGMALFVLRRRHAETPRPFRVPWYPLVPLVFVASSLYVLYSSLAYVRVGALAGVGVLALGGALLAVLRFDAKSKRARRVASSALVAGRLEVERAQRRKLAEQRDDAAG